MKGRFSSQGRVQPAVKAHPANEHQLIVHVGLRRCMWPSSQCHGSGASLSDITSGSEHVEQQNQSCPSDTESATSFQETEKAAMTRDDFDTSCRTCTCGSKRGQTKETQCLSALRALTSSTTAHLQWIVLVMSSEQSRHHLTKACTERQQTNHCK